MPALRRAVAAAAVLAVLAGASSASATVIGGDRWPGTTITYAEALPPSYDWSLTAGIDVWNRSGARIRFVRAASPARAQLRIVLGPTGNRSGFAQLGHEPGRTARLVLSGRTRTLKPADWLPMRNLIAHELGHVLGLDHGVQGGCELMDPYLDDTCGGGLPDGGYACQALRPADLRAVLRLYGGRARRLPARCLIQPAPAPPVDVAITGGAGAGGPVSITWRLPRRVPAGASVEVGRWAGRCGAGLRAVVPDRAATDAEELRPARAGSWTDTFPSTNPATRHCYGVRIVNAFGGPSAWVSRNLDSWADVPPPPVAGIPAATANPSADLEIAVTVRDGSSLVVAHNRRRDVPGRPGGRHPGVGRHGHRPAGGVGPVRRARRRGDPLLLRRDALPPERSRRGSGHPRVTRRPGGPLGMMRRARCCPVVRPT